MVIIARLGIRDLADHPHLNQRNPSRPGLYYSSRTPSHEPSSPFRQDPHPIFKPKQTKTKEIYTNTPLPTS